MTKAKWLSTPRTPPKAISLECVNCGRELYEWVQVRDNMLCCSCAAVLIADLRERLDYLTVGLKEKLHADK
jgi:hypothetical protein